jgi:hypothetical protein
MEIMPKGKEIPRERFMKVAARAGRRRGFEVEELSARPARLALTKEGKRYEAAVRTLQRGRGAIGFDPTIDGHFPTLEAVDWVLVVAPTGESRWHFWVAAVPADVVLRTYTLKWQERCRTRPGVRRDGPVFAFFGPAPASATSSQAIGGNFGQHQTWREELTYRPRLDDSGPAEAALEQSPDRKPSLPGLEDRLRLVAEAAQGLPKNVTVEVHIRLWPTA